MPLKNKNKKTETERIEKTERTDRCEYHVERTDERCEYYENLIKKFDVLIKKEFGKMCSDFEPLCVQCRVHLIYNNFKNKLCKEFTA